MEKKISLESIQQNVKICKKCNLCSTRKNAVPGEGNVNAEIVFIGEAPGKNEDLHGRPFVGAAGKKLDDALESSGLVRNDVYITNIVKCKPPKNRIPNYEEKTMCSNYLEYELSIINPKIICLLGNTAFNTILDGKEISKNHGKLIYRKKRTYFVTFHPAAIIYNQKLEKVFKNDIKKLIKTLQKLKGESVY
jgi:DNA polymerase